MGKSEGVEFVKRQASLPQYAAQSAEGYFPMVRDDGGPRPLRSSLRELNVAALA